MTPLPFAAKLSLNLISLVLIAWIIYVGSDILVPICFSIILAMLLLPLVNFMVRKGVPGVIAMILAILLAIVIVGGVLYFLSSQVARFMEDLPMIKEKLNHHLHTVEKWVNESLNISPKQQQAAVASATENIKASGTGTVGTVVSGLANVIFMLILLPIYTFLILYYRKLIHRFLQDIFPSGHRRKVEEVLTESRSIVQSYMIGLMLEMLIVTALNLGGFLVIGIQYAVFLAVLSAVLNLIPYIGMLIASVICMIVTLTTSDNISEIVWVGVVLVVVQFIDNNFIMPYVVSSKVRINALVSIIGVFIGGALAGISGMFLSIPGLAILKSIFDRVDDLQPWGTLIGDDLAAIKHKRRTRVTKEH
jgi:predicted PurR-regulated permease PerM